MKKILIVIALLLVTANAHAFGIIDVDYTGIIRERIDMCGYGCGDVSTTSYTSNLMYAGGSVANNSVGYAQQFSIRKRTSIDYLLASAHIREGQNDYGLSSNTMYFKLYTGTLDTFRGESSTPYPDVGTASIVSSLFVTTYWEDVYIPELGIWHAFERDGYYTDVPVPFDINLKPGTYWIAQERYAGNTGWPDGSGGSHNQVDSISVEFAKGKIKRQTMVNPEPASIFLFGTGLLGAFIKRRKRS